MGGKAVPYLGTAVTAADLIDHLLPADVAKWFNSTSMIPQWEPFGSGKSSWDVDWGKVGSSLLLGDKLLTPQPPRLIAAPPTPNAARPAVTSGGPAVTPTAMNMDGARVQIDSMVINARTANDAYTLASNMNDALNRKLLVANSDSGVNG